MDHFDHGDMVANILLYWRSASVEQEQAGRHWYAKAGELVTLIAETTGVERGRVAACVAALSPRNPWRWNVFDAFAFCEAAAEGRTMPRATTFNRNKAAAWRAVNGETPWLTSALKVRAFVACILGDEQAVVIDTWAVRIATGGAVNRIAKDIQYVRVAAAYEEAARRVNRTPAHVQATTWLVAQTEGLATSRTGRHDLAFKAGTPVWLAAAMA